MLLYTFVDINLSCLGQRDGQFDELVIGEDVTPRSLKSSLEGRTIVDLKRRGKQMWFVLDK